MLSSLTNVSAIFCVCHRKIIYVTLLALDVIHHFYMTDAAHLYTTPENDNFTFPFLSSITDKEDTTTSIMTSRNLIVEILQS